MKKITANEIMAHWGNNNITPILAAFEEMSSELEALEGRKGMTFGDIHDWLLTQGWDSDDLREIPDRLLQDVSQLTVHQGFMPDWSKAPEWANCVSLYWARMHGSDRSFAGEAILFDAIPRPLPPKVTRERTDRELMEAWLEWKRIGRKEAGYEDSPFYSSQLLAEELVQGKSIKDLCTAAGIPTTTEEV